MTETTNATPKLTAKKCPNCGKPRDENYDPFCSRRCADVDLHRWLNGTYVIPGKALGDEEEDES
jgi:endogenous inhibitor of DNA gyrase (YacG/DUF329 family)